MSSCGSLAFKTWDGFGPRHGKDVVAAVWEEARSGWVCGLGAPGRRVRGRGSEVPAGAGSQFVQQKPRAGAGLEGGRRGGRRPAPGLSPEAADPRVRAGPAFYSPARASGFTDTRPL